MGSPEPGVNAVTDRVAQQRALGDPHERPTDRLRQLIRDVRSNEAVLLADQVAASSGDPYEVARAYLMKLGALINLGRTGECPPVVDRADEVLRRHPEPALLGEFHALAGYIANSEGSLDRGIMHLVCASRVLETVERHDMVSADAWGDLAAIYSFLGFHEHAQYAAGKAHEAARAAGISPAEHAAPEVGVRAAVSYDHRGETARCRDELVRLLADIQRLLADSGGLSALRPDHLPYVAYAVARLAAMGHADAALPLPQARMTSKAALPEAAELRELTEVCRAIAEGRTDDALQWLARTTVDPRTLGGAEVHRLRAMACVAAGDYTGADVADRAAFRVASADLERVRALFVDGIAVRLDHEELRRTVGRYAGEALSDPLTGLANRRSLERRVAEMIRDNERGVLGVFDLDAFKAVNTVHGHLTGDLVLQRIAAVLIRTLRRRDFVARYGGDEFVVILPLTTLDEADVIGRRLVAAVRDEDWESLVPGTPVSASVGWAELHQATGLVGAFRKADRAMLDAKKHAYGA
ncbi:MAG: diguanylate cyclase domain-containing protein [Micromonosporaceae bacterium]